MDTALRTMERQIASGADSHDHLHYIHARIRAGNTKFPPNYRIALEWVDRLIDTEGWQFLRTEVHACGGQEWEVAVFLHPVTGLEFVLIPPGKFVIGSPPDETGRFGDEGPQTEITVKTPFLMCRTHCTQEAWDKIGGSDRRTWRGPKLPIEGVSWDDCVAWCKKAGLRLPSEAEYEYAARAGTKTAYCFGDGPADPDAPFPELAEYCHYNSDRTVDVGGRKPNAFGLFDVHGLLWSWCADVWAPSYEGIPLDGTPRGGDPFAELRARTAPFGAAAGTTRFRSAAPPYAIGMRLASNAAASASAQQDEGDGPFAELRARSSSAGEAAGGATWPGAAGLRSASGSCPATATTASDSDQPGIRRRADSASLASVQRGDRPFDVSSEGAVGQVGSCSANPGLDTGVCPVSVSITPASVPVGDDPLEYSGAVAGLEVTDTPSASEIIPTRNSASSVSDQRGERDPDPTAVIEADVGGTWPGAAVPPTATGTGTTLTSASSASDRVGDADPTASTVAEACAAYPATAVPQAGPGRIQMAGVLVSDSDQRGESSPFDQVRSASSGAAACGSEPGSADPRTASGARPATVSLASALRGDNPFVQVASSGPTEEAVGGRSLGPVYGQLAAAGTVPMATQESLDFGQRGEGRPLELSEALAVTMQTRTTDQPSVSVTDSVAKITALGSVQRGEGGPFDETPSVSSGVVVGAEKPGSANPHPAAALGLRVVAAVSVSDQQDNVLSRRIEQESVSSQIRGREFEYRLSSGHIRRGGCWSIVAIFCRSARRDWSGSLNHFSNLGFRPTR